MTGIGPDLRTYALENLRFSNLAHTEFREGLMSIENMNDDPTNWPEDEKIVVGQLPGPGIRLRRDAKPQILVHRGQPEKIKRRQPTDAEIQRKGEGWVACSLCPVLWGLQAETFFFTTTLQQLGMVDCELLRRDRQVEESRGQKSPAQASFKLMTESLSCLWVMGAFQFLYVLEAALKKAKRKPPGLYKRVRDTKATFVRLRSPFAHLKALRDSDFPYPRHATRIDGSVSWYVNSNTLYSRAGLSERLFSLCHELLKVADGEVERDD